MAQATAAETALYRRAVGEAQAGKPRLFMESFLKIRYADGTLGPLRFTPEQDYYYRQSFEGLRDYYQGGVWLALKHRDARSTTFWCGAAFAMQCCVPGFICAVVIDSESKFKEVILPMFDLFDKNLPSYARPDKGKWDTEVREFLFKGQNGTQMTSSLTFDTARSEHFGRGGRPKMVIFSEEAAYPTTQSSQMLLGLMGSLTEGSWEVHESTPKGTGNSFYSTYKALTERKRAGTILFRRWFDRQDHYLRPQDTNVRPLDATEITNTGTLTLTPEEMTLSTLFSQDGIPDLWRILWRRWRVQMATDASFGDEQRGMSAFLQEYPENEVDCWYHTGNPALPRDRLRFLAEQTRRPIEEAIGIPGFRFQRWEKAIAGHKYLAGLDPAESVTGGDLVAFQIVNATTGRHVLQAWGRTGAGPITRWCVARCREYNQALWTIERQFGGAFIEAAKNEGYGARLYRERPKGLVRDPQALMVAPYGWHTNSATRPLMHEALWTCLHDGSLQTPSQLLVHDLLDYNPDEDHLPDRVSALMLAIMPMQRRGASFAPESPDREPRTVRAVAYG